MYIFEELLKGCNQLFSRTGENSGGTVVPGSDPICMRVALGGPGSCKHSHALYAKSEDPGLSHSIGYSQGAVRSIDRANP